MFYALTILMTTGQNIEILLPTAVSFILGCCRINFLLALAFKSFVVTATHDDKSTKGGGMNKVYPITLTARPEEKAFALYESDEQSPGYKGFHRYQIILVNRGDKLAEYRIDMGESAKWKGVRHINIPALWEHSVAELQHIAGQIRDESTQDLIDIYELLDKDGKITKYY